MGAAAPKSADVTVRLLAEGLVRAGGEAVVVTLRVVHRRLGKAPGSARKASHRCSATSGTCKF